MDKFRCFRNRLAAVLLALILSGTGCGSESGQNQLEGTAPVKDDPVVFYVDDHSVTEGELREFSDRFIGGQMSDHGPSHGSMADFRALELIRPYVRFYALVEEGRKRDILKDTDFLAVRDFSRNRIVGQQYGGFLRQNALIPPEKVDYNLPEKWIRINFQLYLFDSFDEAQRGLDKARGKGEEGLAILAEMSKPVGGDRWPETGKIFPDSGFFDRVDDPYLFSLAQGELSRPVATGLGAAIAYVKERQDFTDEEKAGYLAGVRDRLSSEFGSLAVREAVDRIGVETFREIIGRAAFKDMESGVWNRDVIAGIGDREMTYYQFRWMVNPRFDFYRKAYPEEKLPVMVEGEVRGLARAVALGVASQQDDRFEPPEDLDYQMDWEERRLLYEMTQGRIWNEMSVPVDESELRGYYEQNVLKFGTPDIIRYQSYFTPVKEDVDRLYQRYKKGVSFDKLAEGLDAGKKKAPHEGGIKLKTIRMSRNPQDPLSDLLFKLNAGDVRIVNSKMGFHLVKIIGKAEGSVPDFEDVAVDVERVFTRERRAELTRQIIQDLEDSHSVRLFEEKVPEGTPDKNPGQGDTG